MNENLKSEISYDVDCKEWNNELLKNKASTVYQTSNWQDIYKQTYDSKPFYITVRKPNGKLLAQLGGIIHKKLFWNNANLVASFIGNKLNLRINLNWFYGPIIHDHDYQQEIITEILLCIDKISKENKVTIATGISAPLEQPIPNSPFTSFGYTIKPWTTYITNLQQDKNKLYDSLNKKTRYDIRKSQQEELTFEIADSKKSYDEFLDLKLDARKNSGEKIRRNETFFDMHRELLYKNDYEKLFLVKHNGKIIGGILGVIFNENIIQHGVGILPSTKLLAGPSVTWNALQWCIDKKYLTFDMGGANPFPDSSKEKSIDFFKSKWGGEKYDYSLYTKIFDKTKTKISSFIKNPKRF
jgi:lipid II:glycine glycyltransferase (peptidoglycan interpeptide bridge formation enzyme)